ncbi:diguanylate cyclase [bacterium]|nr:diguanylate cyclase [bacterium]
MKISFILNNIIKFSQKIKFRLFFLLLLINIIFIGMVLYFRNYEIKQINFLVFEEKKENEQLLNIIVDVFGKDLAAFAYDYSFWDETVSFIKEPNPDWAKENFETAFDTYNLQHILLYDKDFNLVYSKSKIELNDDFSEKQKIATEKIIKTIKSDIESKRVKNKWFSHFFIFIDNNLFEIKTAPVQPITDSKRETAPHGYLIAVREWSPEYIEKLSKAIIGDIKIEKIESSNFKNHTNSEKSFSFKTFLIISQKYLKNSEEQNIAIVNLYKASPIIKQTYNSFSKQMPYFFIFSTVLIIVIFLFILISFLKPIREIDKALTLQDSKSIDNLSNRDNEFKKIGVLIKDFIKQKKELEELILHDPLTGLYNRRFFSEVILKEATQLAIDKKMILLGKQTRNTHKEQIVYGVYMLDIDFFKKVNDTYGHDAGDLVIKQFSDILTSSVRTLDVVTRWGGEEFIVVLKDTKPEYIRVFAEKIRKKVEAYDFNINKTETIKKTCSIGFAKYPLFDSEPDLIPFEAILSYIDYALYNSKNTGRNSSTEVVPSLLIPTQNDLKEISTDFNIAIEAGFLEFKKH